MTKQFRQIEQPGWPSGDGRPSAVVPLDPGAVERRLSGVRFREVTDDLDRGVVAVLLLGNNTVAMLLRYEHAPESGTSVYVDADDKGTALSFLLGLLRVSPDDLTWVSSVDGRYLRRRHEDKHSASSVHVVPAGGKWGVKVAGGEATVFGTKRQAEAAARKIARAQGTRLVSHGANGRFLRVSPAPSRKTG
jgi:hypothetical protein